MAPNGTSNVQARGRAGRARRNNDRPNNESREVIVSKKLSWLLRHGAEQEGLKLGNGGYASLDDVLRNRKIKPLNVTLAEIRQIVADNEKQRFSLVHASAHEASSALVAGPTASIPSASTNESADDTNDKASNYLIRANQGHSVKVQEEGLLTPITIERGNLPATVVHGTRREFWARIVASGGLKPMTRNHIHFATGVPKSIRPDADTISKPEDEVLSLPDKKDAPITLSGMRATSTILIFLDLQKALLDGLKFWLSENGVVLSDGDKDHVVEIQYFSRVEERDGKALVEDGRVVGELSTRLTKPPLAAKKPNINAGRDQEVME